jgi:hypothetical protein
MNIALALVLAFAAGAVLFWNKSLSVRLNDLYRRRLRDFHGGYYLKSHELLSECGFHRAVVIFIGLKSLSQNNFL